MRTTWKWKRSLAAVSVVVPLVLALAAVGLAPAGAEVVAPVTPSSVPAPVSGDFNRDGLPDIALTGASGWNGVAVAASNGQPGFDVTHAPSPAFAAWASLPGVKIVTGNFGGNQADDLVLTGVPGWTTVPVALSNGNATGTFTVSNAPAGSFPDWAASSGVQVFSGDFNHDGRTDLALAGGDNWTTIPIAFSNGDGTFTVTNGAAPGFVHHAWLLRMSSGDFDADGRTDLAVITDDEMFPDPKIIVAFSKGDGTFRMTTFKLEFLADIGPHDQVTTGDFNHDGRTDLARVQSNAIVVGFSRGDGAFDEVVTQQGPEFTTPATRRGAQLVGADFDCDGRTDLAVLPPPGSNETTIPVLMPRSAEAFAFANDPLPHFPQLAAVSGAKALTGDYDGDGCTDLALTGGAGWDSIPVAVANGDGSFHEQNAQSPQFAGWAAGASPVTLPPAPAATTGALSILDTDVISGIESSIAVGSDGLGITSYYASSLNTQHRDLRVAHCANPACTEVTTTDVDTAGDVGKFSSIKIGQDGLPLISYVALRNASNAVIEDLKVAHCSDVACTAATVTTLDAAARVSDVTSLTIGGDGLGLISYQDAPTFSSDTRMKVAHCRNTACTSRTLSTIDTVKPDNGESGGYSQTGIATGNHGLGLVTYYDGGPHQMLKVAACTNADCSTTVRSVVDRAADPANQLHGGDASVTFGHDGLALIAYNGNYKGASGSDLKVAHCRNVYCTEATKITADTGGHVGWHTSIAVGGDGLGVVSYYDATNDDLKVAHCADLACSSAKTTTVDSFDDVGYRSSITMGTDGLPLISYVGPGVGVAGLALRVVRCGNSDCTADILAPF